MFGGLGPLTTSASRWELDDQDPINRGLLGLWPLGEAGGAVARDITPFRRHGTLTNFTSTATSGWGVGPHGRVLNFDGTNDHVPVVDFPTPPFITISAWVKAGAGGSGMVLNKNYNGSSVPYSLCVANNGTFGGFAFFNGGWRKSGVVTDIRGDGKWHFVEGSYDGATLRYYIDGRLDSSAAYAGTLPTATNTQPPRIGVYLNDGAYYAGAIAGLRVHGRVLARSEGVRLYRDPWAGAADPAARLFFGFKAASSGSAYTDAIADSLTAADAVGASLAALGAVADALTGADTIAASLAASASLSDATTAADALAVVLGAAATLAEALAAADALANGMAMAATLADAATAAEAVAGGLLLAATTADSATAAETALATLTLPAALSDALAAQDSLAAVLAALAAIADDAAALDALAQALAMSGTLADVLTAADALLSSMGLLVAPASRTIRLPARTRATILDARDRTISLPARSRTITLAPERN